MKQPALSRRQGLALGAAAAASSLLALRETLAQTAAAGGDWLAMIQQHHGLIARAFDELMASNERSFEQLDLQLRTVDHLINAHSLAEEAVIYPAMARAGMTRESQKLYLDEANVKILKSRVALAARDRRGAGDWRGPARDLQQAVLTHAKDDEEGRLFPQLRQKLSAAQNQMLTEQYPRQFAAVIPVR